MNYRYQFEYKRDEIGIAHAWRESADPSMIFFKGKYYIFSSMSLGVYVSDDMAHWENKRLPSELPTLYDYAPDVRVIGDYVYYCASRMNENSHRYRTKDILNGPYEKISDGFPFWDPNLFMDDDGRMYFYWGCSNAEPIFGVELDVETLEPVGTPVTLIEGKPEIFGYERIGENHIKQPLSWQDGEDLLCNFLAREGKKCSDFSDEQINSMRATFRNMPFIEGAWMDKHNGRYYLQYAFAGTEFNIYGDGVYVSEHPLGPFRPQKNNPYSYCPGGFLPGAGHGSTMRDYAGNLWHTASSRISKTHIFERCVSIWPAGFDEDGEMFCNQRYGDWPRKMIIDKKQDPWRAPEWMLLSVGKNMSASSCCTEHPASNAAEENVQTWWEPLTNGIDEWLQVDLGKVYDVHAIQINFADGYTALPCPNGMEKCSKPRFIDDSVYPTRWKLWGSVDGERWDIIEDKSNVETDLFHDFIVRENGIALRYLKLTNMSVPYDQTPCISGIRVFGKGHGSKPEKAEFDAVRVNDLSMKVEIRQKDSCEIALGYNILWGHHPDKLYHSCLSFDNKTEIGALVKDEEYYIRVDAFNENGITEGEVFKL